MGMPVPCHGRHWSWPCLTDLASLWTCPVMMDLHGHHWKLIASYSQKSRMQLSAEAKLLKSLSYLVSTNTEACASRKTDVQKRWFNVYWISVTFITTGGTVPSVLLTMIGWTPVSWVPNPRYQRFFSFSSDKHKGVAEFYWIKSSITCVLGPRPWWMPTGTALRKLLRYPGAGPH